MKLDLRTSLDKERINASAAFSTLSMRRFLFLTALMLCITAVGISWQFYHVSLHIKEREEQLAFMQIHAVAQKKAIQAIEEKLASYRRGIAFVREGLSVYEFVSAISGEAAQDISLLRMEYGEKEARLFGVAEDERAILAFAERVEHLVCVFRSEMPEIHSAENLDRRQFVLRCTLR